MSTDVTNKVPWKELLRNKWKDLKKMASLWEKIQENKGNIEAENRKKSLWTDYLTLREQMVRAEYRRLCPVRGQDEEQHIESMQNEGQHVLEKLRRREAMMDQKSQQLREMYQELMAMSQEPHELLLQGLDDMFRRSESMQQQLSMPQTLNLELTSLPISGLTESYSHFLFNFVFEFTSICPDNVKLFNVMRRCSFRPHGEDRSVDSARSYLASWGPECFIAGKYYWELDLNNSWNWTVGACKDSWISNRNQLIESEGAFLLVCVKEGDHYSLLTTCPVFQHYIERPLGRIGVFLDCEEGSLTFLNFAKSSLIHKYAPGTVNPSVRPFFSTGPM
ncbi:tripartite motif-containing protein 43-like [Peromyscus leucopus]|uniref:tripartite motif-containing protein 43-like n=1 Tax=Peromyscus leucopus TaxID=10041 RepID=UPI0018857C22|nr:tripartite motif-containing protein 43-like [Peromyscus leucopus]